MTMLRGFIGQSYSSKNPQFDCSRAVNWYPWVDENQTGSNQQISGLNCRSGLTTSLNAAAQATVTANDPNGYGRGGYTTTNGLSIFVVGKTVYMHTGAFFPYGAVVIGTLLTSRGQVSIKDNGQQCVIVDGPYGYYFSVSAPTAGLTQINDPAFYGSNFVDYYDGYFIFAKPGTTLFYWSSLFSVGPFNALNFASKSGNADPIAAFFVLNRQLWLLGTQTSEIWYDVGGTTTFQRLQGPYNEVGILAPNTLAKSEIGAFWVAQSERGGATVLMTVGNGVQKVSTLTVDYKLQEYGAYITRSTGYCYQENGSLFYVVNPYNGTSSWAYDATVTNILGLNTWHERTYTVQPWQSSISVPNGTQQRWLPDFTWFYNGQVLCGDYSQPMVYAIDGTNATDNGAYINLLRQAPHISNEMNLIFYSRFRLLCQTGIGSYININNTTSTETQNTLNVHASTVPGGCTNYGYAASAAFYGGAGFGTLSPNSAVTFNVSAIAETETGLGTTPTGFDLWIANSSLTPAQTAFNYLEFIDGRANVQIYFASAATYTANSPSAGIAHFHWNPYQTQYNSMVTACSNPIVANVLFDYNVSSTFTTSVVDNPQVMLSWSDDGGYNYSDEISMPVGQTGQYGGPVEWWRLSYGRNRVFRVRYASGALSLFGAAIEFEAMKV
jgi:hypothetical protein